MILKQLSRVLYFWALNFFAYLVSKEHTDIHSSVSRPADPGKKNTVWRRRPQLRGIRREGQKHLAAVGTGGG